MSVGKYSQTVNNGHPRERQNMVFNNKWSLFRVTVIKSMKSCLSMAFYLQGGLYSEVVSNTGLTVMINKLYLCT